MQFFWGGVTSATLSSGELDCATRDTRKIGRRSSNGCIGLYNEHIEELFALAQVGTQVKLI